MECSMCSLLAGCLIASLVFVCVSGGLNVTRNDSPMEGNRRVHRVSDNEERILSRKKRYLTFPEGSSLQLIYCLTIPVLAEISYAYGYTVSMAWQLPHDTRVFLDKKVFEQDILIHRRDRRDLYSTIETFLQAHGLEGRACVLKGLCESAQRSSEKRGFFEELLRAIFTLPQVDDVETGLPRHYDEAYTSQENCTELYPECPTSLFQLAVL